jgi:hypothetical protein
MSSQSLSVHLELPPLEVFSFPPRYPRSSTLPPYHELSTLREPFKINPDVYYFTLDIRFPFTVAAMYIAAVIFMNGVNGRRLNKPWNFSKTRFFKALVIMHNASLALFSGWAFCSICQALGSSWPTWEDPNFLANAARALCQTDVSSGTEGEMFLD